MYNYNPYMSLPQQGNQINWVNGVEGAKAWQLQPNSNTILLDSENENIFYIKVSDNVGMCTLRTFRYEEISSDAIKDSYVTKDELKAEVETIVNSLLGGNSDGKQTISRTK